MQEKTYSQMRQEFIKLYQDKIIKRLPEYNRARKEGAPKIIAFFSTFCSFLALFLLLLVFTLFGKFLGLDTFFKISITISTVICVFSFCSLIFLTRNDKAKVIKNDYEMDLKRELMLAFVNIFFENATWAKYYENIYKDKDNSYSLAQDLSEANKKYYEKFCNQVKYRNFREQKLLNPYPFITYDDCITGQFRGVSIKIYEGDTNPFGGYRWVVFLFLLVWLAAFTGGLILVILPILLLIFSFKIYQYSPFRGLIVEFDMNKNFKGHTIVYEKSYISQKMPVSSAYEKVMLETSDFSNKYRVFSNNQIEARYLLTPSMMERIESLKFTFKAKYVRCSFLDTKLVIAIHTGKDMFAMGNDFKESNTDTFSQLYDEMISILKIVDELKLNQHIGL